MTNEELKKYNREKSARWREKNPEKSKEHNNAYKGRNKEKLKEKRKIYVENNREKVKIGLRKWYLKNREYVNEYNRLNAWRKKNPEKALDYKRKWQRENKNKLREERIRRRARKLGVGGDHTFGEWETLKVQYNFTCPCCQKKDIKLTEDHIIPLTKGGSNNIENIQPLCQPCNSKKHTKIIKFIQPAQSVGQPVGSSAVPLPVK